MSRALWQELAADAGLVLADDQLHRIEQYIDLLLAANQRMNLTRITDRDAAGVQHIGDALTLLPHLPSGAHTLADLGSGGGVPGIALAIARPDVRVTLIESVGKKAAFLIGAMVELRLRNVRVWHGRAEAWRGACVDIVTCRAVARLGKLIEWCDPLVKQPGGALLAMKGPKLDAERAGAAEALATRRARLEEFTVNEPLLAGHRIARVTWG